MADEHIRQEPHPTESPPEPRPKNDDNRFRVPDPVENPMATTALVLGVLCLVTPLLCMLGVGMAPRGAPSGLYICIFLLGLLNLILGPATLIFGILGIRYRCRHPTAGGLGHAIAGVVIGLLISLLYWGFLIWLATHPPDLGFVPV